MDKLPDKVEISSALIQNFGLNIERQEEVKKSISELKSFLAGRIKILLDKDMQSLLNIFYRLDIDEKAVSEVLNNSPVKLIPSDLADLIIQREIKKAWFRKNYRS